MKLSSLAIVGILVAALVVMAAPVAKADGVPDPLIIINLNNDPASCPAGDLCIDATNSATNPLVLTAFDESENFFYSGCDGPSDTVCDTPLTTLFIELLGPSFPPGNYTCSGDAFLAPCGSWEPPAIPGGLELDGTVDFTPDVAGTILVTPEPAMLLLLGIGMAAVVGFRRKLGLSGTQAA